jgi:hypothetical protein
VEGSYAMARRPMDEGKKTEQRGKSVLDWTEERARTFPPETPA